MPARSFKRQMFFGTALYSHVIKISKSGLGFKHLKNHLPTKKMTLVEFDKHLNQIDFSKGANIQRLDDYLLACLAQLDLHKDKQPSYELFLMIYDQARNGPKVDFESSWKELYGPDKEPTDPEFNGLSEWENLREELRSLITDLIHTRAVRSQPGYIKQKHYFEWDSEGGVRFYNGTTPGAILGYAATRFEGEYHAGAFQEREVTWGGFSGSLWIGISYE